MHHRKEQLKIKKTFVHQHTLPKLPVPPLNHTKVKLLEWIEPLVSNEQYEKTRQVVHQFFRPGGDAGKLQQQLRAWDQARDGSWLTPLWEDMYLKHRGSLPLTSNFNILLEANQTDIAGKISFLLRELYHSIIDETLEPHFFKGKPLDMGQYTKLFRSVRIPQLDKDTFYVAEHDKKDNHVVILYKNNVYKVPVTNEEGIPYSIDAISSAIQSRLEKDADENDSVNVGIFTTAERDEAAQLYNKLKQSNVNADTLQTIADSLAIISIDECSETSQEALENLMLHPTNKHFDKTIQIVLTKNGEVGFNIEHSAVDGMTVSTVVGHIFNGLQKELIQTDCCTEAPRIEKKEWDLSEDVKIRLEQLRFKYLAQSKEFSLLKTTFNDFGAEKIKELQISPDAFFHMALQLAQYRTYGEFKSVYEPVSVGYFHEGRTENARATSMEKRILVEAIESGEESNETLYSLMKIASNAHSARIQYCQKGLGVERHLFGLEQMYYRFGDQLGINELPELFRDEGYVKLRHDFISTSGMIYPGARSRMFAPVVEDGHGLAYFILDHSISLNLSSFTVNEFKGKQLMNHMIAALEELRMIAEDEMFIEDIS
ncbi:carnitine O-acetyltransferase [Gracilibacillus halotolerans]|uniref:Carnitine O-acetyltransferase n=1 Tax=Gracilibacillus halotolerans TaxID=74386 RepID=A0A841RIK9_9BACI|nr:choline/carnitine O-acyltransferase [Gracilibacillus halotolerans]MBB6512319.1 carnitine O-acetyltransferase [Gracilibacillus halotolerans]